MHLIFQKMACSTVNPLYYRLCVMHIPVIMIFNYKMVFYCIKHMQYTSITGMFYAFTSN